MTTRKIIPSFLIVLYLFAVSGFIFHNCHCEQSQYIAFITLDHCSGCGHKKQQNEPKSCCETENHQADNTCETDEACCETTYQSVDIDQENPGLQVKAFINIPVSYAILNYLAADESWGIKNENEYTIFGKSPPESYKTPLIYHNCQLRL